MTTVLLHGFLGAPAQWDRVRGGRPDTRAPWMPGHGPSPWTADATSFDAAVDAFAPRVWGDDARVTLVGYSLGARVALSLAMRHPARVRAAVLVGVSPGLDDPSARAARAADDDRLADALLRDGLDAFVDAWDALPLFATQRALDPAVRATQHAWRRAHDPAALAWSLRALSTGRMPPMHDALAATETPVRLVTGSRDDKFTALARAIAARNPRIAHTVVDGAGHNVALEQPDALRAVIPW